MAFCSVMSHSQALRSFWKKDSLRESFRNLNLKDVDLCGRAMRLLSASVPEVGACAGSGVHQSPWTWRSRAASPGWAAQEWNVCDHCSTPAFGSAQPGCENLVLVAATTSSNLLWNFSLNCKSIAIWFWKFSLQWSKQNRCQGHILKLPTEQDS